MDGDQQYFDPLFDAYSLRVIDLREILNRHQIYFPSTAKKAHLVELFDKLRKVKHGSLSIDELQKENAHPNRSPRRKFLEISAMDSGFGTPSTANTSMRITRSSARGIENSTRKFLPFTQRSEILDEEEVEILKQEEMQQRSPLTTFHTDTHPVSPKHYNWEQLMDTPAVSHFSETPKIHSVQPAHNPHFEKLQNEKYNANENKFLGRSSIPTVEIPVHSRSPSSSQTLSANVGLGQNSSPKLPDSTFLASPTLAAKPARLQGVETQTSPMFLSKHQKSSPDIQSSSNTSIYASPLKSPSKFQNFTNLFPSRRTPLGETNSQPITQTPPREYLQFQSDSEAEYSPTSGKRFVNKDNEKVVSSPVSNSSLLFASQLENLYAKNRSHPEKAPLNTPSSFFTVGNRIQETYSPNEEFAESLFAQKGVRPDTTNPVLNNVSLSSTENSFFGEQEEPLKKGSQTFLSKMGKIRLYGVFLSVLFVALSIAFWQQEVRRVGFCEIPEEPYPSYISSIKPKPVRSTLQSVYTYLNIRGLKAKCVPCPSSAKCGSNREFVCESETKQHIPFLSHFGFKPHPSCTSIGSVTDRIENMIKGCVDMVEEWYTQNGSKTHIPQGQKLSQNHFHSSVIDKFYEEFKDKMDLEVTMDEFKVYFRQALERLHILKRKKNGMSERILVIYSHSKDVASRLRDVINANVVVTLKTTGNAISHSIISFVSSIHQKVPRFALKATLQSIYDSSGSTLYQLTTKLNRIYVELLGKVTRSIISISGTSFELLGKITQLLLIPLKKYWITALYFLSACVAIPYLWSLFISFYSTEKLVKVCVKHCVTRLQVAKKNSLKDASRNPRIHLDELRSECFIYHPKKLKDLECLKETSNITQKRVWRRTIKVIDQMVSVRVFDDKLTNKRAWEWIGVLPDNAY